tara:strand:- start:1846 stop:2115 length:270 start_codon:yes stop_codon:yes gene_type:complete
MDINQITALQVAQLSEQDYENLMKTIKRARDIRAQHKMNQFNVGDEVSFMDKQGRKQMGQIQKICSKNVKLKIGTTNWTVHPNFLSKEY